MRIVIGTIIFLPMAPVWLLVGWVLVDELTLVESAKETWQEYKRLLKGGL